MRFFITGDSYWETRVDKVLHALNKTGYDNFFNKKYYGDSIDSIVIVLMCRDPEYNFKQRIRFAKKEKTLYIDIMLDMYYFIKIDQKVREAIPNWREYDGRPARNGYS